MKEFSYLLWKRQDFGLDGSNNAVAEAEETRFLCFQTKTATIHFKKEGLSKRDYLGPKNETAAGFWQIFIRCLCQNARSLATIELLRTLMILRIAQTVSFGYAALSSKGISAARLSSLSATMSTASISPEWPKDDDDDVPALVLIGNKELMTPCKPIDLQSMSHTMKLKDQLALLKRCQKHYGGIGIAGCQVGWRARVFCMGIDDTDSAAKARYPDAPDFPYQFWINPTIETYPEKGTCFFWEGCLSVPGMRGWVERSKVVKLSGWNEHGEYVEQELSGLPARVAQHEFDHLDGILFPQRSIGGTLLPVATFEGQHDWAIDFPTPGARKTKPGSFCDEK